MKKTYSKPTAEPFYVECSGLMALSTRKESNDDSPILSPERCFEEGWDDDEAWDDDSK